jgi:TRAP-type C4-dicarboxylate transport system permease large subunit
MPTLQKIFSLPQLPVRILPFARVAWMFILFMLSATLVRLGLYFAYPADFQMLNFVQVISTFGVGLQFDASMALVMLVLPLLCLLLPFRWSHHRYWQRLWQWIAYALLLAFILMMVVDTVYFGYVHRHVGSEINTLTHDKASMVGVVLMTVGFGMLAPPVGLNVYVVNRMAKDVPIAESYRGVMPFLISDTLRMLLILFCPSVCLWLVGFVM